MPRLIEGRVINRSSIHANDNVVHVDFAARRNASRAVAKAA